MSIPHQNFPENSLQFKTYKGYLQGGNGISFWAFLLSILAYISIFYIFNLSPSSALNTTQFWFFISNTLILIIAADSGAFFSWKKQPDPYEEYATINRGNSHPSFDSQYREIVNKIFPLVRVENSKESREEIEVVVEYGKGKSPENKLQMIAKGDLDKSSEKCQENVPEFTPKVDNEARGEKENEAKCVRTMSDLGRPVTRIEKNIVLRRTGSEKHDPEKDEDNEEKKEEEEEDEFAAMSNEELNRRVEEFIGRFNRQIRLQSTQNKGVTI